MCFHFIFTTYFYKYKSYRCFEKMVYRRWTAYSYPYRVSPRGLVWFIAPGEDWRTEDGFSTSRAWMCLAAARWRLKIQWGRGLAIEFVFQQVLLSGEILIPAGSWSIHRFGRSRSYSSPSFLLSCTSNGGLDLMDSCHYPRTFGVLTCSNG